MSQQQPEEQDQNQPSALADAQKNLAHINDFNEDQDETPLMSNNETAQEFFELARYNDEDNSESRLKELAIANPKLLSELALDSGGRSALHMAVANGFLNLVKILVCIPGCDVNIRSRDSKWTPLHDAVVNNRVEITALLLSRGADPVAANDTNETPIEMAEKLGREEISALLLRADKSIETYSTENGKITMDIDESEIDKEVNSTTAAGNANGGSSGAVAVGSTKNDGKEDEKKNLDVDDVE
jgi:ankyrin repeat protein